MLRFLSLILICMFTFPTLSLAQLASDGPPKVTIDVAYPTYAVRGADMPVIITQNIIPHWHTYWVNPGDSGEEMKLKWELSQGIPHQDIKWPAPERILYGPLTNFGYKGQVDFLTHLSIPADFKGDTLEASARVRWLVCEEICIPEQTDISFTIPVIDESAAAFRDDANQNFEMRVFSLNGSLPENVDWDTFFYADTQNKSEAGKNLVRLKVALPDTVYDSIKDNFTASNIEFFPTDYGLTTHKNPVQITTDEDGLLDITIEKGDLEADEFNDYKFLLNIAGTSYNLTAQKNNDTAAILTQNSTETPSATNIDSNTEPTNVDADTNTETSNIDSTSTPAATNTYDPAQPELQGVEKAVFEFMRHVLPEGTDVFFVTFLLFSFLGGIILNLMPCVFPVLSMKALSVVKLADYSILRLWGNGIFYTLGVLVSFAVIAGALLLLREAGHDIGWGFQLQNPNVVIILSWLIFAVGLNLSGMFNVTLGSKVENMGGNLATQPGISGAFFTGMLATVVATPCTAAFMGTALGAAIFLPTMQAMSIFLMLGFGLAFPYLLICMIPPLVRLLPRPGSWMETFRQFLAFPMYATAIFLVWVVVRQVGDVGMLYALGGMLVLGFGIWLWRHSKDDLGERRPILSIFAAIFIILPLLALMLMNSRMSALQGLTSAKGDNGVTVSTLQTGNSYVTYDQKELDRLLNETTRPIFVNMTASWCVTCLLNEQTSLSSTNVQEWMATNDVVYMKGDWTNYGDHITQYLSKFGRNGVPIYVFYAAPNDNGTRPEPVLLPQILTPSTVTDLIP